MTAERFTEENLDRRQEMLNYIYDKFISFPATDIVVDLENESDLGATKFSYYFPKGTTTPGYIDHIAGTHDIKTGQVTILYEKGKNAGRVTLIKNPETSDIDLKSFIVFQKENNQTFSIIQSQSKPHIHAIVSLLNELEVKMEVEPEVFKTDVDPEEQSRKDKRMVKLYSVIFDRLYKKQEKEKQKKKGRSRRNNIHNVASNREKI